MHEYDIALKSVLRRLSGSVLRELTGLTVARWHNAELPEVHSRRADMLGETADGTLLHIELQSTNQSGMALRMLEYATAIRRQYRHFPEQIVLYTGGARLRMKGDLDGPNLRFHCRIADVRVLDAERLLASGSLEDNVLAVLARLDNEPAAVGRILCSIARRQPHERAAALAELMVLAGLRNLEPVIEREVSRMPILNDIMDHKVIGRERKRGIEIGLEKGLEKGRQEGREKGRKEGEQAIVLRQITQRFGPLSSSARKRIEALPVSRLDRIALKLLDAASLEELLG